MYRKRQSKENNKVTKRVEIGVAKIPLPKQSLTATYTATDWREVPVTRIGDVMGNFSEKKNFI